MRKKGLRALKMEIASLEERLRDAEMELSNERALAWGLLNALDDPIFIKDKTHRWVFVNDAACLLWRHPREFLVGKSDHNLFPKEQADGYWEKDDLVFEMESPLLTEEAQTIGGRLHTISTRKSIYRDPRSGEPFVIGVMRDISEYKRAIDALRESQARYRTLLEAIPGGVFVLDREFRYVLVNSAMCRVLKAPESEILYTRWDTLTPDIADTAFFDVCRRVLDGGKADRAVDEIRSRDGERVFYEVSAYPVPEGVLGIAKNVSAERAVEERLKRSKERFRMLVQNFSDVVIVLDAQGRATYVSPSIERVLGHRPESLLGNRALDYVHPEDRPRVARKLAEAAGKPGAGPAVEFKAKSAEGGWVWVEVTANNLLDEPRVGGIVVNLRDTGERKRAIQTLIESEKRFRGIVETAPSLLLITNREGKNIFVGPNCEEITGWRREELLGSFIWWVHEDDSARMREAFSRAIDKGESGKNHVYKAVRKNGEVWYASSSWVVAKDGEGKVAEVLLQTIDITKTVKAFELHAESEKKYRILVENANETIVIIQDGVIQFANPRALELTGFTPDELCLRVYADFIHPADLDAAAEHHRKRLRGEPVPALYEIRIVDRAGRTKWVQVSGVAIPWNGKPATLNFLTDVTEKKAAGEALRHKENELRQSQKMDAIGRLAGGIAHDFNNLLTAIIGYTEILESRAVLGSGSASGGDVRAGAALGYVREIRKAADRASSLTRQLLAFSRKQRFEPRLVNVNALVEGTCAMLRRLIGENIEIVTALEPGLAPVKADPSQIEQVIMNLALNARDAMPEGGTLAIRTANASPGRAVKGFVLLEIEDTGCGMDDEVRKHLFEPFYTTKENGKGTGLGLATVYGNVKQSRGFIFVSSETGKGTTFRIFFPRCSGRQEAAADSAAGSSIPYGRETILLVDGDDGARSTLAESLKGFGYTVLTAAGAHDAVELAGDDGRLPVDLILARQVSPAANERRPMEELASRSAGTKLLFISGTSDEDWAPHVLVTKMREILDGAAPAA